MQSEEVLVAFEPVVMPSIVSAVLLFSFLLGEVPFLFEDGVGDMAGGAVGADSIGAGHGDNTGNDAGDGVEVGVDGDGDGDDDDVSVKNAS